MLSKLKEIFHAKTAKKSKD